jgi:hypothetical protein
MSIFRSIVIVSIATAFALAISSVVWFAAVAAGPVPAPVAKLTGSVSPNSNHLRAGTPLALTLDTRFASPPASGVFVLQRLDYRFPHGTVVNGRLFPSCAAAVLERAHGRLSACPQGSKIGSGVASGTAVALGVTSHATVTLFNGPGGRSVTMNVSIITPALIDATISAPLVTLKGRWANELIVVVPDALKTVVGGDIVTSMIHVTTGATRIVHGVKRGYIEAVRCPKSGARIHGDFTFSRGAVASADTTVAC